jgi:hypothetical protein
MVDDGPVGSSNSDKLHDSMSCLHISPRMCAQCRLILTRSSPEETPRRVFTTRQIQHAYSDVSPGSILTHPTDKEVKWPNPSAILLQ